MPVLGADRQTEPLARQPARVGDDPGGRSAHVGPRRCADVDAAVLATGVRIVTHDERPEHRPVDGPAPGSRSRGMGEPQHDGRQDDEYVARFDNHAAGNIPSWSAVVKFDYSEAR